MLGDVVKQLNYSLQALAAERQDSTEAKGRRLEDGGEGEGEREGGLLKLDCGALSSVAITGLKHSIVLYVVQRETTKVKLPLLSTQHQGVNSPVISSMLQCFGLHFLVVSDKGQCCTPESEVVRVQFRRGSVSLLVHFVKMCSVFHLLVLSSLIGCVELISVTTPQKYVNVTKGASVKLQCMFVTTQETTSLTIQWDFVPSSSLEPEQVYYYQSGKDVIPNSYVGRIQPPSSPAMTRNASIVISNMQPSDAGVYSCEVHNFPDVDGQSQVNIVVNVLERPSTPYCSVHGDVESGHLVTLTCHSEHGSPKPKYTWVRLDQTKTRRPVLGRTTTDGILQFRNISQFEFGEYLCNATNVLGFSTCTVDLSPEVGDGVIAGAVIGALLGCLLIILFVWFIAHTMKKQKYKAVRAAEANEMNLSLLLLPTWLLKVRGVSVTVQGQLTVGSVSSGKVR
ncbi:hypothetical protein INR49_015712, partial [Caranx melampygus]